jgi:cysteine desulfurase / selenocysteine lyase
MLDIKNVRKHFPVLDKNIIYLDSAATCQKPRSVLEAMDSFLSHDYGTVHRAIYSLSAGSTAKYDAVRAHVAAFIDAGESEEIIFTKGSTDGINLVASCFGKAFIKEGDEILVCETEHHSNIIPWQILCDEKKAHLKVIPVNAKGEIEMEVLAQMLSSKVKLVAVAHLANATGVVHDVKQIIKMAHACGSKVLVDAAQSAPHMVFSVRELDVDFLVFSGHKLYGPTGIGVLYGKKELLKSMGPYQGGGDMVNQVSFEGTTYQEAPLKFEAGTPNIAGVIGLGAALLFIEEVGREAIASLEKQLVDHAVQRLKEVPGLKFLTESEERSSLLSFNVEGCHPLDIGTLLDVRGICVRTGHLCAQPALKRFGVTSVVRASFGLYNTLEEVDRFVDALKEVVNTLR